MIMDGKGKLFGKVSIVDILIVIVVVFAIGGIGYKFSTANVIGISGRSDKLEFVFIKEDMPNYLVNSIKESTGLTVLDTVQNQELGKIVDVKVEKSKFQNVDQNGKFVETSKPGYSMITVTVAGSGRFTEKGALIGPTTYAVGQWKDFKFGRASTGITITGIRKLD